MTAGAFQLNPHDPAAFDRDPLRAYNVGPDALLLNFNAIHLHFIPNGDKVSIFAEPELSGITLENRLTGVGQGDCTDWDDTITPQLNNATLSITGTFPSPCGERAEYISPLAHSNYLNAVFRTLWQELGGTLGGEVSDGIAPSSAKLFATHNSPPTVRSDS
ncbi:MAG: D-alanyl-D-alanine carboxypeptidase [Nitrosomonadales bacterium]